VPSFEARIVRNASRAEGQTAGRCNRYSVSLATEPRAAGLPSTLTSLKKRRSTEERLRHKDASAPATTVLDSSWQYPCSALSV
jgi:hypothetical protein